MYVIQPHLNVLPLLFLVQLADRTFIIAKGVLFLPLHLGFLEPLTQPVVFKIHTYLVEAGGVEPPSENHLPKLSTSVVIPLKFPSLYAS